MELRPLGTTGIEVSVLGLGTVKLGRNLGVKYPEPFLIPDDVDVRRLLATARELEWVIVSKVGESFAEGVSRFDFSARATRRSVEASLKRLGTDYLDLVLIHSDGDDLRILEGGEVLETLIRLKQEGLIRAYGMSTKTITGGLKAVECCDAVM